MGELVESFEGIIDDESGEGDVLVPVPDDEGVEVSANLSFASVDFKVASHDGSEGADDAVASFRSQTVAVSEQIAMAKNIESTISSFGDFKLDIFAVPEVAG